jgi:quercetin 2,3-dioxygenase
MFYLRKSSDRGGASRGWLRSFHTFSFADYYDEKHMNFGVLRVINEDFIAAHSGFAPHGHQNMEIISYIVSGALEHEDSMGNKATIYPGELQRMSAGTGVRHSEYNRTDDETHLLQIWILPERDGIAPSYEQKSFLNEINREKFLLVASRTGRDGSISLFQDTDIYVGKSQGEMKKNFSINPGRKVWVQLIKGQLKLNEHTLGPGDAIAITDEKEILLHWSSAEFLLFDLVG